MVLPFFIIRKSFKLEEKFDLFRFVEMEMKMALRTVYVSVCVCAWLSLCFYFSYDTSSSLKSRQLLFEQIDAHWIDGFVMISFGHFQDGFIFVCCFVLVLVLDSGFCFFFYFSFLMGKIQRFKIHHKNICYWTSCVHIQCSNPLLRDCFARIDTTRLSTL